LQAPFFLNTSPEVAIVVLRGSFDMGPVQSGPAVVWAWPWLVLSVAAVVEAFWRESPRWLLAARAVCFIAVHHQPITTDLYQRKGGTDMPQFMLRGPTTIPHRKAPTGVVLMLLVLCGSAVAAYLISERPRRPGPALAEHQTPSPMARPIDYAGDEDLEDISNHLQHARDGVAENVDKIKRAQARIEQVLPLLEQQNFLMYKARLQLADTGCTAAISAADRALEELDMAKATVRRRRIQQ
jgi:hypothetical protein